MYCSLFDADCCLRCCELHTRKVQHSITLGPMSRKMGPDVFSPFSINRFNASAIVSSVTPSSDTFFFADDNLFKHDLKAKFHITDLYQPSSVNNKIQGFCFDHLCLLRDKLKSSIKRKCSSFLLILNRGLIHASPDCSSVRYPSSIKG